MGTRRAGCKMWEAECSLAGTSSCLPPAQCPTWAMCAGQACQAGHTTKPLAALASLTSSLPVMLSRPYPLHLGPCRQPESLRQCTEAKELGGMPDPASAPTTVAPIPLTDAIQMGKVQL